jgi:hypothetical protein
VVVAVPVLVTERLREPFDASLGKELRPIEHTLVATVSPAFPPRR